MRQLPIVEYENKRWFFDERLRQIRNIGNPHDFQDLNVFEVAYFKNLIVKRSSRKRTRDNTSQQKED